ncbi:helix-turn-helix domain-containing protein [Paenibacillus sp. FSL H8-0034]|uniref:helix-turn-helix domain-containing protein n=1 Tax=Paenibacillus sp. FSL H8-0034 TaxID=2954671 RepID=UPI0030F92C0E
MQLDAETVELMQHELQSNIGDERYRVKLRAVLFKHKGLSNKQIADELNVSTETIRRWILTFNDQGHQALREKNRSGRPSSLAPKQEEKIISFLEKHPVSKGYHGSRWSIKMVQDTVLKKFNVHLSKSSAHRLLSHNRVESRNTVTKGEQRGIRRDFEKRFIELEHERRAGDDCWYVHRLYLGRFLENAGLIKLNYDYELFCAVNISDIDLFEESQLETTITTSSMLHPPDYSRYTSFISRLIKKGDKEKGDKSGKSSKVLILMQQLDWEKAAAEEIFGDCEKQVEFLFAPINSLEYNIRHFIVMEKLEKQLRKSLKNSKLSEVNVKSQLVEKVTEAFMEGLKYYEKHKTFGKR